MIKIKIHNHEKMALLAQISKLKGTTMSVAKLAKAAGQNPNRARFIIEELIDEGKVRKVQTKAFNDRYKRYTYEVIK